MPDENPRRQHEVRNPQGFATTRWSMVLAAGKPGDVGAREALSRLCETYWMPLCAYVLRRVGDPAAAQDLTQAFFTKLLEKNYVGSATPERGRFRAYLLTALKHFLSKQWEQDRAQKRGGGRAALSLDFAAADSALKIEPTGGLTAEQLYDQQWALALLRQIMQRLEAEYTKPDKAAYFQELKEFLIGDQGNKTFEQAAIALGITPAAARKAASRMRHRYRVLLREEIAHTVTGPGEVDDEIRNLFTVLAL